jgi:hypothetical protein
MGYSNARAIAANDALISTITKIEFYTANYGTLLGSTNATFGASAMQSNLAVANLQSTPIADTWDASGTVGSVRCRNASDVVVIERSDANAVGLSNSTTAFIRLSSLSAVAGGAYNITSGTHSFDSRMENES